LADATERTIHGFTQEQLDFLREEIARKSAQGFDRTTLMWLIGGLVAIGIAVSSVLWAEIGSVRAELRDEIRENRTAIAELAKGQAELAKGLARIEAILEERLPRGQ
jgi:hypothetical protein